MENHRADRDDGNVYYNIPYKIYKTITRMLLSADSDYTRCGNTMYFYWGPLGLSVLIDPEVPSPIGFYQRCVEGWGMKK